jgi:serine/threonine-protein kinase
MDELRPGQHLGRYRLKALLGEGGMALVYRAVDPASGQEVALKVVHPRLERDPAFVARFLREARVVGRLQHPHILPLYDTGEQDGRAYLVTPYVPGGTLEDWLARRPGPAEILALVRPVAAALDHAHERGVIHRDVKPTNVLVGADGTPYLADFGIAQAAGDSKLTATGAQIGSVLYMAPEQAQGLPLSGATDQYALGSMVYEALTGRPPFPLATGDTSFSLILKKINQVSQPPSALNPALPPACDHILLRALAKEPERRFPTCVALIDALASVLANPAPPPPRVTTPLPAPPPFVPAPPPGMPPMAPPSVSARRSPWWVVGGVGLALLLCLGLSVAAVLWRLPDRNAPAIAGDEEGQPTATTPRGATRTAARAGGGQQGASISGLATAEEITGNSRPNRRTTEFRVGEEVYITYTANRVEAGQFVELRIYRENGSVAYNDRNSFDEREVDYDGYFIYTPNTAGSYRIELSLDGSASPAQRVEITVR